MSVSDRYRHLAETQDLDAIMRAAAVVRQRANTEVRAGYDPASNALELQLAGIWREVLELDLVGVADNFFELGGDSLQLAQVLARVRKLFGRDVPIGTFFDGPTIRHLATVLAAPAAPASHSDDLTHMLDLIERAAAPETHADAD